MNGGQCSVCLEHSDDVVCPDCLPEGKPHELIAEAFDVWEGAAPGRSEGQAILAIRALWSVAKAARGYCAGGSYMTKRDAMMKALDELDAAMVMKGTDR